MKGKRVLDVGCGTGIATRQLANFGAFVCGTDVSQAMIHQAKQTDMITSYFVAPTNSLPFDDNMFDCVTAFSAFHWFYDEVSIAEIRRVLPNGIFFVINKNDVRGIRRGVVPLFEKYTPSTIKRTKEGYNPEIVLATNGFEKIHTTKIVHTETYSLNQAVEYLQSIALWNQVSESNTNDLLSDIKKYCVEALDKNGFLFREFETVVVSGHSASTRG